MNILSLQSWVAYGHVGNASAMFPLQRLGAEVWAVQTVQLSNHTGYGDWTGEVFSPASVQALVDGVAARGAFARCDAVLSGYVGDPGVGEVIAGTAERVRAANPRALWCCDPVIGDTDTGAYVRPGVAAFFAERGVPGADILTPNSWELSRLSGGGTETLEGARASATALQRRMRAAGPGIVLVTSLRTEATPADAIDMLVLDRARAALLRTPLLPIAVNGAGDALAALFLFHLLQKPDAVHALEKAAASVFGVLQRTASAGARELALIEAQDELVRPVASFRAISC